MKAAAATSRAAMPKHKFNCSAVIGRDSTPDSPCYTLPYYPVVLWAEGCNSPPEETMLTAFLATWGALLSTFGLGWNLYRDLHDRARVRLDARIRRLGRGDDGRMFAVSPNVPVADATQQLYVCITVVNEGRRPVLITTWGGTWIEPRNGRSNFVIYGRELPKMLTE
jgi:hypothetical protein